MSATASLVSVCCATSWAGHGAAAQHVRRHALKSCVLDIAAVIWLQTNEDQRTRPSITQY